MSCVYSEIPRLAKRAKRKPGARYWPKPISSALQLWVYYGRFLRFLPIPNYLVETHRNPKTSHSQCNSAAFRAKELESGVSIAFQRVFRHALTKMDIEGHRSTVAPCPDIASLQTGKSDLRSPWLPRNKIAGKQNCTLKKDVTLTTICSGIWPPSQPIN